MSIINILSSCKKYLKIIINIIKEYQVLTFLICSTLILVWAFNIGNNIKDAKKISYPVVYKYLLANKIILPESADKIATKYQIDTHICSLLQKYADYKIVKTKTILETENTIHILYMIENDQVEYNENTRKEIEEQVTKIANGLHYIWSENNYRSQIDIEFGDTSIDLVYFYIEDCQVTWSSLNEEEKWRPGDDLTEWLLESSDIYKDDEEYIKHQELYETIYEDLTQQSELNTVESLDSTQLEVENSDNNL